MNEPRVRHSEVSKSDLRLNARQFQWLLFLGVTGGWLGIGSVVMLGIWCFQRPTSERTAIGELRQAAPLDPASPSIPASTKTATLPIGTVSTGAATEPKPVANEVAASPDSAKQPTWPITEFPDTVRDYAFGATADQASRLAIIGPWKNAVGFLDVKELRNGGKAKNVALVETRGIPICMTFKVVADRAVFLIGQQSPDSLAFVDAKTLKLIMLLPLSHGPPLFLAGANRPESPYVYFRQNRGTARVDVTHLDLDYEWLDNSSLDFAIDHDGADLIYLRHPTAPTGLKLFRLDLHGNHWRDVKWHRDRFGPVCLDPRGRFVAAGSSLFTPDLQDQVGTLPFEPKVILRDQPWFAGTTATGFAVGSINDLHQVTEVPFPAEWFDPDGKPEWKQYNQNGPDFGKSGPFARVFADESQRCFVLGTRRQVVRLDWDQLSLPPEPLLALKEPPPRQATVGQKYEVALQTVSGNPTPEILTGPEWLRMENRRLTWSPKPDQFGTHRFRIRWTDGPVTTVEQWRVTVNHDKLPVPFSAFGCDTSTNGRLAVVWGFDVASPDQPESKRGRTLDQFKNTRLALFDLQAGRLIVERTIDRVITNVELNDTGVYAAVWERNSNDGLTEVQRLSAEDLSPLGLARLPPGAMSSIADQILIMDGSWATRSSDQSTWNLPSLEKRESSFPRAAPESGRVANGWLFQGVIWDDTLTQPQLLISPAGIYPLHQLGRTDQRVQPILSGYVMHRPAGTAPNRQVPRDQLGMHSPDVPVHLRIADINNQWRLIVSDSIREKPLGSLPLIEFNDVVRPKELNRSWQITTTSDYILITMFGEVFRLPINMLGAIPVPFRIAPRQAVLSLERDQPTEITYSAAGSKTMELRIPAFDADKEPFRLTSNGNFKIDPRPFRSKLAQQLRLNLLGTQTLSRDQIETRFADYRKSAGTLFQQLTGQTPNGFVGALEVTLEAQDTNLNIAVMQHVFLVELPDSLVTNTK